MEVIYKKEIRTYEIVIIFADGVRESKCIDTIENLKNENLIKEIISIESLGKRQLATRIRNINKVIYNSGIYYILVARIAPERVRELRDELKFNGLIIRFRILKNAPVTS